MHYRTITIISTTTTITTTLSSLPLPPQPSINISCVTLDSVAATTKLDEKAKNMDNEYVNAGAQTPKILLTTAREPSDRLKRFIKEMRFVFPNAQRINRGGLQMQQVVEAAITNGFTDIVMIHETRGEPDSLVVCHLPYGPTATFTMFNVVMRHDANIKTKMSEAFPHLIFHNMKTKLGERVATILKYLFPVPKVDSQRIMTFSNDNDFISFRHHVYKKEEGKIKLKEVGPRFELQLYEIRLGNLDQKDADVEWVLRPYMRVSSEVIVILSPLIIMCWNICYLIVQSAAKKQYLGLTKEELKAVEEEERNRLQEK